jgi:heme-degrading monooxygenase HmoA
MYGRVSIIEAPADKLDEGTKRMRDEIVPALRQLSGCQGVIALVDRTSGKNLVITLWDTEDDLRASEEQANQLRRQAAESVDATAEPQVERYEVALYEVEAGVTVS